MLSPKVKRNIKRIIPFGIIWLCTSLVFLWTEYAVIGTPSHTPESAISISFEIIVFASITTFFIGALVGLIELVFLNRLFIKKSFRSKIVYKFLFYALVMYVIVLIAYLIAASMELDVSISDSKVWDKYKLFFFSITHISTVVQLGFSLLLSLLYAEISEHLGQNILRNFFTGKYHKPISEERIFMFTDMKSSTTIAEELGHDTYFKLLRDYYHDMSDAIIKSEGEVYQYIGDEVVISWPLNKTSKSVSCINCFFNMKSDLNKRKDWYMKTYGFFPDFKAALHYGEVTSGEIGALKKEIFFVGDVLNTTARIQDLCNAYHTDLLLSEQLASFLELDKTYVLKHLGTSNFRGKQERLALVTLEERA
ncbi:adenylate/guanylate cyclase domain-containing protein [Winogradskyella flava]|uniref:Adenylate/guanylate cyclase domain-containing protein n=1 Tax=Winogradskyella flava TaxID=1884876 RepID=A0A842IQ22_9FLAO|nr:adenylate/guanylate cyclase domain-containing protein [Winogradskyella flava]MBC2844901.1 adenylate/guanylate cyclase domain-containing protein [Winogradskyella flava]